MAEGLELQEVLLCYKIPCLQFLKKHGRPLSFIALCRVYCKSKLWEITNKCRSDFIQSQYFPQFSSLLEVLLPSFGVWEWKWFLPIHDRIKVSMIVLIKIVIWHWKIPLVVYAGWLNYSSKCLNTFSIFKSKVVVFQSLGTQKHLAWDGLFISIV